MTKNSNIYFLFLTALCFFTACRENGNGDPEGSVVISGNIEADGPRYFLLQELTPTDLINIDTIAIDSDGFFSFELDVEIAGFYRIVSNNGNFITIAPEPGEKIYITASSSDLRSTYTVEGSYGSELLWKLNNNVLRGMAGVDSLRAIFREARTQPDFKEVRKELREEYRKIKQQQKNFVKKVIDENPQTLASILALYQFFEDNLLLNEDENFYYFEKLSKSLCMAYPTNKHVINLKKRVNEHKREKQRQIHNEEQLAIGNVAPEISLPDPEGNYISLSSLKGNIVLIDFWAAWCPPCREANALIGKLYSEYNDRGFEVYAISLDRNREQWLAAIERDNINWLQVSDLRFMNSPVVSLYNINEVPQYVLLDRENRILARNFSIDELESLLLENL